MIRAITCYGCSAGLGFFNDATGGVIKPAPSVGMTVLAAVFDCVCGYRTHWNGIQIIRRLRKKQKEERKENHNDVKMIVAITR